MNVKKIILATVCLAVLLFAMDFLIHGHLLMEQYKATATLWRPMEEMNPATMGLTTLIFALIYVFFFSSMVNPKNIAQGLKFGFWFGLAGGFSLFCVSTYMPIPMTIACAWFAAALIESVVGGALVGFIMKD